MQQQIHTALLKKKNDGAGEISPWLGVYMALAGGLELV